MAEEQVTTTPEAPEEIKSQAPHPLVDLWREETKKLGDEAQDNLFKIMALAETIIDKAAYVYTKKFVNPAVDTKNFEDEEEISFLFNLERVAEMIIEKVEQINRGVFA